MNGEQSGCRVLRGGSMVVLLLAAWSALLVAACGARTGPLVPDRDGSVVFGDAEMPGALVSATCQCDQCSTRPWCLAGDRGHPPPPYEQNDGFMFFCADSSCSECTAPSIRVNIPTPPVADPTGASVIYYCAGRALPGGDRIQCAGTHTVTSRPAVPFMGSYDPTERVPACLLTDPDLMGTARYYLGDAVRTSFCGSTAPLSYSCNVGGMLPYAQDLMCPKPIQSDPRVCVEGNTPTAARDNARAAFGAMCRLWTGRPRSAYFATTASLGLRPQYLCYARMDCGQTLLRGCAVRRDATSGRVINDPGHMPQGTDSASASGLMSTIAFNKPGFPAHTTGTLNVSSIAWWLAPTGAFYLTGFDAQQTSAADFDGHAVTNGWVRNESVWFGQRDAGTGIIHINAASIGIQSQFYIDGVPFAGFYTADVEGTAQRIGDRLVMDLHFRDYENNQEMAVHVDTRDTRARPTATVASVSSTEPECTSPQGATVSLTGTAASNVTDAGLTRWTLRTPDFTIPVAQDSLTASVLVPVGLPATPASTIVFNMYSDVLTAGDSVDVRVVDTTPPSISASLLQPACGWGQTASGVGEPNPQQPSLCTRVAGTWSDTCSTPEQATVTIEQVDVLAFPSGALISSRPQPACLTAAPGYLDTWMSAVDYVVRYRVRDPWGNASALRQWRGYFYQGTPTSECSHPVVTVTISDVNL